MKQCLRLPDDCGRKSGGSDSVILVTRYIISNNINLKGKYNFYFGSGFQESILLNLINLILFLQFEFLHTDTLTFNLTVSYK